MVILYCKTAKHRRGRKHRRGHKRKKKCTYGRYRTGKRKGRCRTHRKRRR